MFTQLQLLIGIYANVLTHASAIEGMCGDRVLIDRDWRHQLTSRLYNAFARQTYKNVLIFLSCYLLGCTGLFLCSAPYGNIGFRPRRQKCLAPDDKIVFRPGRQNSVPPRAAVLRYGIEYLQSPYYIFNKFSV